MTETGEATRGRIACYTRVSSEEQQSKLTIETQDAFLKNYCDLYGYEPIHELGEESPYKDNGVSGNIPLAQRPGGRKLLEDAEAGKIDTVLVYKLDRVGRSLLNVIDTHDRLEHANVALSSATEPIDTSTPSGRLIFHMLASFAEFERQTIQQRTRDGMKRFFQGGGHVGRIPYGYNIDSEGNWLVEEGEARVIREMAKNVADGSTLRAEARRLTAEGVPAPGYRYRGRERVNSGEWRIATVSKMFNSTTYTGQHKVKSNSGEIIVECPPLVDSSVWEQATERVKGNKTSSVHTKGRFFLLSGMMVCGACGTPYRGNSDGKGYYYYKCGQNLNNETTRKLPGSHAPSVNAPQVEDYVWSMIKRFVANPGEVIEQLAGQAAPSEEGSLVERKQRLAESISEKKDEKERYVKLYAKGALSEDEADGYIQAAITELSHMQMLYTAVDSDLAASQIQRQEDEKTVAWLRKLNESITDVEADTPEAQSTRRYLVEQLLEKITVYIDPDDNSPSLQIDWHFDPPEERGEEWDGSLDGDSNTFVYTPSRRQRHRHDSEDNGG